ncbi:MAG TPA: hypothetical protein VFA26_13780 [Gemmataceae bacterium]|nr:hypothetical protein [Gemmataceae bacterium]
MTNNYLFPNFLTDLTEYGAAEELWRKHWYDLLKHLGDLTEWDTPWLNTTLADGTPCRDGNPIFSAVSLSRRLGIRVIQLEPSGNTRELYFWMGTFGQGEAEAIEELVISCVLTKETLYDALDIMNQWLNTGEVVLSRVDGYLTFPLPPRHAKQRDYALVAC